VELPAKVKVKFGSEFREVPVLRWEPIEGRGVMGGPSRMVVDYRPVVDLPGYRLEGVMATERTYIAIPR
jgi:hypothetical protein